MRNALGRSGLHFRTVKRLAGCGLEEAPDKSRTCRARFPADQGSLYAAAESLQLSRILALLGGPRAARGRLRRRPPSAAAAFRAVGFASLGLAELRGCLIRGKQRRRQGGQGRQGRRARRMGSRALTKKTVQKCAFLIKFPYVLEGLSNSDSGRVCLCDERSVWHILVCAK